MFHANQVALQQQIQGIADQQTRVRLLRLDTAAAPNLPFQLEAWRKGLHFAWPGGSREQQRAALAYWLHLQPDLMTSRGEVAIAAALALFDESSWGELAEKHALLRIQVEGAPPLLLISPDQDPLTVLHVMVELCNSVPPAPAPVAGAAPVVIAQWPAYGALVLAGAALLASLRK